jgi:7,8-dihydroneopterin aldolase/epimerase/oxygenase
VTAERHVTIELRGLELRGYHGVEPEERQAGQRFLFDLWLEAPEDAARSDRIADAVDYREVAATVRNVSDGRAFRLLEALAAAVADELLARFPLERVRVRVRKPEVKLADPVEYAAVSAERASSSD